MRARTHGCGILATGAFQRASLAHVLPHRVVARTLPPNNLTLHAGTHLQDGYSYTALGGGIGRVYTQPTGASAALVTGAVPSGATTTLVFGINTVFSRQFRGFAG